MLVSAEKAAAGHLAEEAPHGLVEGGRVVVVLLNDPREEVLGQQLRVFGVEAEHYLVEIAGQHFRVDVLLLHVPHDGVKDIGRFLGGLLQGAIGAELVR